MSAASVSTTEGPGCNVEVRELKGALHRGGERARESARERASERARERERERERERKREREVLLTIKKRLREREVLLTIKKRKSGPRDHSVDSSEKGRVTSCLYKEHEGRVYNVYPVFSKYRLAVSWKGILSWALFYTN
jgi:hypothetical protein